MSNKYDFLIIAAIIAAALTMSIGITAGLVQIVCWAFGLTFKWRYALGIWAAITLLGGIFKGNSK